jgi:aconitate hydratase/homoaconitate hydratase
MVAPFAKANDADAEDPLPPRRGAPPPLVETGEILRIRVDWDDCFRVAWNGMNATYEKLGRRRFTIEIASTWRWTTPWIRSRSPRMRARKSSCSSRGIFRKKLGLRHFLRRERTIMHTKFFRDLVQPDKP